MLTVDKMPKYFAIEREDYNYLEDSIQKAVNHAIAFRTDCNLEGMSVISYSSWLDLLFNLKREKSVYSAFFREGLYCQVGKRLCLDREYSNDRALFKDDEVVIFSFTGLNVDALIRLASEFFLSDPSMTYYADWKIMSHIAVPLKNFLFVCQQLSENHCVVYSTSPEATNWYPEYIRYVKHEIETTDLIRENIGNIDLQLKCIQEPTGDIVLPHDMPLFELKLTEVPDRNGYSVLHEYMDWHILGAYTDRLTVLSSKASLNPDSITMVVQPTMCDYCNFIEMY